LTLFTFTIIRTEGQVNSVLNYSFEQYTGCSGIGYCGFTAVNNWYQPTINGFNWCSYYCGGSNGTDGVPQNFIGYQNARTGMSYALVSTDTVNQVDYITGTFSDSLKANTKYCITFYVSLADSEWWASDLIGAYLSNDSIICNYSIDTALTQFIPQIENPFGNFLTNKLGWVPISGEYQAHGGEIFINIGDFYKPTLNHFDSVGHGGFIYGENTETQTGYYIEDVFVRKLAIAVAGKNDTICAGDTTLIGQNTTTTGVSFHWLPTAGLSNPNIPQPMASPTVTTTYTLTVTNDSVLAINNRGQACNCVDSITKDSVTISVCTGINEIKYNNRRINIYPNPCNGNFILTMNVIYGKPEIQVYNVLGQIVFQDNVISSNTLINLGSAPEGVYFYRILTETEKLIGSGKLIIEK